MAKLYYRISEVSDLLGVPASTLRYWESQFPQLKPKRSPQGGRRVYDAESLGMCGIIKELLHERGMKIEAVRQYLTNTYRRHTPRRAYRCRNAEDAMRLLDEARAFVSDSHGIQRIEAVQDWIRKHTD